MRKLALLLGGLALALVSGLPAKANTVPHSWRKLCVQLAGKPHKPWWYTGLCYDGAGAGHYDPTPAAYTPPEDCWPFKPGKKHPKKWDKWEPKHEKHGKKGHKKDREFGGKFWPKFDGKKHDRKHGDVKPGKTPWPKFDMKDFGKKHNGFKPGDFGRHENKGRKDFGFKFDGGKNGGKKDWGKPGGIFSEHGKPHDGPFSVGKFRSGKFGPSDGGGHIGDRHLSGFGGPHLNAGPRGNDGPSFGPIGRGDSGPRGDRHRDGAFKPNPGEQGQGGFQGQQGQGGFQGPQGQGGFPGQQGHNGQQGKQGQFPGQPGQQGGFPGQQGHTGQPGQM